MHGLSACPRFSKLPDDRSNGLLNEVIMLTREIRETTDVPTLAKLGGSLVT